MRFGGALIAAATMLTAAPAVAADDEPICADRPGIGTGTCTVPSGVVQVETGFVDWVRDRSGAVRADEVTIGETAVKLGLSDRLHVELVLFPFNRVEERDRESVERVSGFGDIVGRAKYRLTSEEAPVQFAVSPFVALPTGRRGIGGGRIEGGVVVPVEHAIPGSAMTLVLSPELALVADSGGSGHHLAGANVIGLEAPLSPRLSGSAELGAYWGFDRSGTVRQYVLAGSLAWLASNDVQLDAGVNLGLNRHAPDVQAYSGIAVRF